MVRPLNKIAAEVLTLWGPRARCPEMPAFIRFALPYVDAMLTLKSINDTYGLESGDDIVLRFLTNVGLWRGEDARRIKAELNEHLKEKSK